ncbi:hypothetical protein ACFVRB_12575 [Streptomyces nojiriensis]|uniref:hypothetical protein n=1 Tax=Streptomyces nojiriensis TaxID=66374 RepID=UPI0036DAF38E
MEPRELWERNALLAEAFCSRDDRVREAQAVMDEALASRTRALAALAVTVGSDATVADLMGLNEREVRVARRTVGKDDARTVADQLLNPPASPVSPPAETSLQPPPPVSPPAETSPQSPPPVSPPAETSPQPPPPVPDSGWAPYTEAVRAHMPHPRPEAVASAHTPVVESGTPAAGVTWTTGMDSVLQWSWQSGLDLQTVAEELGLNPMDLLLRAQMLATEGRLQPKAPAYDVNQSGRHRRHDSMQYSFVPDSPETLYSSYRSASPYI